MRRRELFTKTFNRVTFGAIASVIANPLKMGYSVLSSHSDTSVRPTPIDAERSVPRQKTHNWYLMTYDWADQLHRQTSRQGDRLQTGRGRPRYRPQSASDTGLRDYTTDQARLRRTLGVCTEEGAVIATSSERDRSYQSGNGSIGRFKSNQ